MNLDWKLILTHIVGFVITVWILKRFAWKPLLALMEERRQKIKAEFDRIADKNAEVDRARAEYEAKVREIDNLSRQKLAEAVKEGQKVAAEIKEHGRQEAKEIIDHAKAELGREVDKARVTLKEDMVRITIGAAEKIIATKLDEREHRRLISDVIDGMEKA
jgi:F-type H+-transporting ATPase subunit b